MKRIDLMVTFARVIQYGSFTAAAEQMGQTRSVISKHVTQLEQALGVQLIYRTTRRLSLTAAGEQFYGHCQDLLAVVNQAQQSLADYQEHPTGRLRLTAPRSWTFSRFKDVFLHFMERYPAIQLDINISGRQFDLYAEGIDLAIRIGWLDDSSLKSTRLLQTRFQTVASPRYLERHGMPEHPKDLQNHRCLIYSETGNPVRWPYQVDDSTLWIEPSACITSGDAAMLMRMVVADQGFFMGPCLMFEEERDRGEVVPVLEPFAPQPMGVYALYPSSHHVPRNTRLLLDFLKESIAGHPAKK